MFTASALTITVLKIFRCLCEKCSKAKDAPNEHHWCCPEKLRTLESLIDFLSSSWSGRGIQTLLRSVLLWDEQAWTVSFAEALSLFTVEFYNSEGRNCLLLAMRKEISLDIEISMFFFTTLFCIWRLILFSHCWNCTAHSFALLQQSVRSVSGVKFPTLSETNQLRCSAADFLRSPLLTSIHFTHSLAFSLPSNSVLPLHLLAVVCRLKGAKQSEAPSAFITSLG